MSALCACMLDEEERASLRISQAIDRELNQNRRESAREFKLLLLGTGEAGKSTFIKQMRIIHGQGYSDRDRAEFKTLVYRNMVKGIFIMINAMEMLKIPYQDESIKSHIPVLTGLDPETVTEISPEQFNAIRLLWADEGMAKCFQMRNHFQISDSAKHYFDSVDRISAEDYIPSLDDVLRVRVPTTGIVEYNFQMKKEVVFKMVDVGGQRSERRKWIHCFEGVKAIIFLTAINEYDQSLAEDMAQNRMRESLALFETIISYPWFQESSIILFMNKTDLFMEKIVRSPISQYFPGFKDFQYNDKPAKDLDPDASKEFIRTLFLSVNPDPENKRIFSHFTCATDTENIKRVFEDVREHVLEENLKDYNLM